MKNVNGEKEGMAILLAILMVTLFLTMVLILSLIFVPKLALHRQTRGGLAAEYAADSIMEHCIFKNRRPNPPFIPPYPQQPTMTNSSTYTIDNTTCENQFVSLSTVNGFNAKVTKVFKVYLNLY